MLRISPVKSVPNAGIVADCTDNTIASVAKSLGRESLCMHANMWRFKMQPDLLGKLTLFERMIMPKPSLDYLREYHGINLEFIPLPKDPWNEKQFLSIIQDQLASGMPVLVETDAYYNHWTPGYQKFHVNHTCLLTGLEPNYKVHLVDAHFDGYCVAMEWDFFYSICRTYGLFKVIEPSHLSLNWHSLLKETLCNADDIQEMENAFKGLYMYTDLYEEQGLPPGTSDILQFQYLSKFPHNRRRYSTFLYELFTRSNYALLHKTSELVLQCSNHWEAVRLQMHKISLSGNSRGYRSKLATSMRHAIQTEQVAMEKLVQSINEHRNS